MARCATLLSLIGATCSSTENVEIATRARSPSWDNPVLHSLFCVTLLTQRQYERDLLAFQQTMNIGLFKCDEFQIWSNVSAGILFPGKKQEEASIRISLLNRSLDTTRGGAGGQVAANTRIFQELWRRIFQEKRFLRHQWTIKLDVD
ncbi:unnamed protein product, partial [Polarella glacialis]